MTGDELSARFHERFGAEAAPELSYGDLTVDVPAERWVDALTFAGTSWAAPTSTGSPPSTNWTRASPSWCHL